MHAPDRLARRYAYQVLLVEDNQVFREALELLLGLRSEVEVVASVGACLTGAVTRPAASSIDAEEAVESTGIFAPGICTTFPSRKNIFSDCDPELSVFFSTFKIRG